MAALVQSALAQFPVITKSAKPTAVAGADVRAKAPAAVLAGRRAIILSNNDPANNVYYGDVTVTAANGAVLNPNAWVALEVTDGIDIYVVCDAGKTADVRVLECA